MTMNPFNSDRTYIVPIGYGRTISANGLEIAAAHSFISREDKCLTHNELFNNVAFNFAFVGANIAHDLLSSDPIIEMQAATRSILWQALQQDENGSLTQEELGEFLKNYPNE